MRKGLRELLKMDELKVSKVMRFGTEQEANIHRALLDAEYHSKKDFLSTINDPLNEFFKEAYIKGYEQAEQDIKEEPEKREPNPERTKHIEVLKESLKGQEKYIYFNHNVVDRLNIAKSIEYAIKELEGNKL